MFAEIIFGMVFCPFFFFCLLEGFFSFFLFAPMSNKCHFSTFCPNQFTSLLSFPFSVSSISSLRQSLLSTWTCGIMFCIGGRGRRKGEKRTKGEGSGSARTTMKQLLRDRKEIKQGRVRMREGITDARYGSENQSKKMSWPNEVEGSGVGEGSLVAQWLEHWSANPKAMGSFPIRANSFFLV